MRVWVDDTETWYHLEDVVSYSSFSPVNNTIRKVCFSIEDCSNCSLNGCGRLPSTNHAMENTWCHHALSGEAQFRWQTSCGEIPHDDPLLPSTNTGVEARSSLWQVLLAYKTIVSPPFSCLIQLLRVQRFHNKPTLGTLLNGWVQVPKS